MYAVVQTGGKQYRVAEGDHIEVEKLNVEPGSTVELNVILLADGSVLTTDNDDLVKAKVFAEVIEHTKGDKALVFKFKKRKGYKRLRGHRQDLTVLNITGISATGTAPRSRKAAGSTVVKKSEAAKAVTLAGAAGAEEAEKVDTTESTEAFEGKASAAVKKPVKRAAKAKPVEVDAVESKADAAAEQAEPKAKKAEKVETEKAEEEPKVEKKPRAARAPKAEKAEKVEDETEDTPTE